MTDGIVALGDMAVDQMNGQRAGMPALTSGLGASANIDKEAKDFEAMFATQLMQPMFETVPVDATFGGGNGEEVMRTFMLQEYGKIIAKSGKLGIASQVKSEMLRAQERAHGSGSSATPGAAQAAYLTANASGTSHAAN